MKFEINSIYHVKDKYDHYLGVIRIIKITENLIFAKFSPTDNYEGIRLLMEKHEHNIHFHGPGSIESTLSGDEICDLGLVFSGEKHNFMCKVIFVSKNNIITLSVSDIKELGGK